MVLWPPIDGDIDKIDTVVKVRGLAGRQTQIVLSYLARSKDGRPIDGLKGEIKLSERDHADLYGRIKAIIGFAGSYVPNQELAYGKDRIEFSPYIEALDIFSNGLKLDLKIGSSKRLLLVSEHMEMTDSQASLVKSVDASSRKLAWEDIKRNLGVESVHNNRVFISYRNTKAEFAESVAKRLEQEALHPWIDQWNVVPGDSLPNKIEQAFNESIAFIPIISIDYKDGKWATAELETAITKRINSGYRIIPLLYEKGAYMPPLLEPLVYADFTAHDPKLFESQMLKLIDGIYGVSTNPYRK